jgi:hypothetical protein
MMTQVKISGTGTISEASSSDEVGLLGAAPETERGASFGMVVQSGLHRNMQRLAEMTNPKR